MEIENPQKAWETIVALVTDKSNLTIEDLNEELREFGVDVKALDLEIARLMPLLEAKWQELQRKRPPNLDKFDQGWG